MLSYHCHIFNNEVVCLSFFIAKFSEFESHFPCSDQSSGCFVGDALFSILFVGDNPFGARRHKNAAMIDNQSSPELASAQTSGAHQALGSSINALCALHSALLFADSACCEKRNVLTTPCSRSVWHDCWQPHGTEAHRTPGTRLSPVSLIGDGMQTLL